MRGIGLASVIPEFIIGITGLADYFGPTGWFGLAELLGWGVVCVVAGLVVAHFLGQWHKGGARRYAALTSAVAVVGAFTYAPYWLGLDAPMVAKVMFTTSLQVLGSLAPVGLIVWPIWSDRRRS